MVRLWADAAYSMVSRHERDELEYLMGGDAQAECKDVPALIALTVSLTQTFDVIRVVKHAVAVQCSITSAERFQTVQAGTFRADCVNPPVNMEQLPGIVDSRENAAVDDWDEVRIGQSVHYMPRPGPVNTADDHIAVECASESFRRKQRLLNRRDPEAVARVRALDETTCLRDLGESLLDIVPVGPERTVEVALFEDIVIYQSEVRDSSTAQGFSYDRSDATKPDDADVRPREILLGLLAPYR